MGVCITVSVSDSEYVVSEQFTVHIADHRPEVLSLRDVAKRPRQADASLYGSLVR